MFQLLAVIAVAATASHASTAQTERVTAGMPIAGAPETSAAVAGRWARSHGATRRFVALAPLYWRLGKARKVRPEVAYAQAAKETNFGRFTGVLDASFRNPCGMKVSAGGGNYDPNAHERFRTWRLGVAAHLDHLALYAGLAGYPKASTPDPRHFPFLHGRARTVQALGGNWAPSRSYGTSLARLVHSLLRA